MQKKTNFNKIVIVTEAKISQLENQDPNGNKSQKEKEETKGELLQQKFDSYKEKREKKEKREIVNKMKKSKSL